ncbi:hypothetical protein V1512DRAFT_244266 [Lipomyces arxii]|uniref:uncharacterized protein n=1 Tax=Lipomyces arxii TaxID=56418 RepID=UPI0034CE7636
MRFITLVSALATVLATRVLAQLVAADIRSDFYLPNPASADDIKPFLMDPNGQNVLYGDSQVEKSSAKGNGIKLSMTDALGVDREISIFAGLVRQVEDLMYRLQDPSLDTLVLAPTNTVMQSLKRKPWEDEVFVERSSPMDEERRAMENISRFVLSHVVLGYGFDKPGEKKTCGAGASELWYENNRDGRSFVYADKANGDESKVRVLRSQATHNGQVWTVDGVLN